MLGARAGAQPASEPAAPASALELTWISPDPSCEGTPVANKALQLIRPGTTPRPLDARAELTRDGGSWEVQLQTQSASHTGRRVLRGETCEEIQQAIALLLAMILESEGEPSAPAPAAPAPAPTPPAPPYSSAVRPAESEPASAVESDPPAAAAGPRWLVRAEGSGAQGLKPKLGLGIGGAAGVRFGALDLSLGFTHWPATSAEVRGADSSVALTRQSIELGGCFAVWHAQPFSLATCLSPELTLFQKRAADFSRVDESRPPPLVSLSAALDLRYALLGENFFFTLSPGVTWEKRQPFRVTLRCEAPCETTRPIVYTTQGLGPRLRAGLLARF
jgi:hypothetical protein